MGVLRHSLHTSIRAPSVTRSVRPPHTPPALYAVRAAAVGVSCARSARRPRYQPHTHTSSAPFGVRRKGRSVQSSSVVCVSSSVCMCFVQIVAPLDEAPSVRPVDRSSPRRLRYTSLDVHRWRVGAGVCAVVALAPERRGVWYYKNCYSRVRENPKGAFNMWHGFCRMPVGAFDTFRHK